MIAPVRRWCQFSRHAYREQFLSPSTRSIGLEGCPYSLSPIGPVAGCCLRVTWPVGYSCPKLHDLCGWWVCCAHPGVWRPFWSSLQPHNATLCADWWQGWTFYSLGFGQRIIALHTHQKCKGGLGDWYHRGGRGHLSTPKYSVLSHSPWMV